MIGRLADHATIADAQRELDLLAAQFAAERPAFYKGGVPAFRVVEVREALTQNVNASLRALGFAVAFVLLVCCINVANLSVARMSGRAREIAVRTALGAGRARLARQLVTESMLLSIAGGAMGVLLGLWGIRLLAWAQPMHLPRQGQLGMDSSVAIFSLAITLATGALLGILPALRLAAGETVELRGGRADSTGRSSRTLQRFLVVSEVAVACVLLVAAGLMFRSFVNLMSAPLGFNPDGVVTAWMPLNVRQFSDVNTRLTVHNNILDQIRALPGVEAASAGTPLPFHQLQFTRLYGRSGEKAPIAAATQQSVLPGYLGVMGTHMLDGRDFTADDIAHRRQVVIVDARIARQLWPSGTGRAIFDVWPLRDYVNRSTDTRFTMTVFIGFAIASVFLAMIGLYGTLSHLSALRSREFGVRIALGAARWRIVAIVAREGFALTVAGAVIGVVAALGMTGIFRGLLYGVEPVDLATLSGVVILTGALAMAACVKPAWSAGKTDPLVALRYE